MLRNNKTGGTYTKATAVTKSDTDTSSNIFLGLYIGEGNGDLVIEPQGNSSGTLTLQNVPTGTLLPIAVNRVLSTNNTCSGIVGLS